MSTAVVMYLKVGPLVVRLASQCPYLIEENAIAPDITGCGVPAVGDSLGCCPLHWDLSSVGGVVILILQES